MTEDIYYNLKGEEISKSDFDLERQNILNRRFENIKNSEKRIDEDRLEIILEALQNNGKL